MEGRYKEVEPINDIESEPLIRMMPYEDSKEDFQYMNYIPSVECGDMIINGRLITAVIRNCGQFVNYIIHIDDGIYYTHTVSGLGDNVPEVKTFIDMEISRLLMNPL